MPVHTQSLLITSAHTFLSQKHVIRLRELAITRADVQAHAEEVIVCVGRRVFERKRGRSEGNTVVV